LAYQAFETVEPSMMSFPMLNWLLVGAGVLMGSVGSLCMKWGAIRLGAAAEGGIGQTVIAVASSPLIVAGVLLYAIPAGIWIWLLRTMPLTILQPALSLTYVVSAILAVLVLNEPVSLLRWMGILVIIAGVMIVARS